MKGIRLASILSLVMAACAWLPVSAQIRLPRLVSDSMVLQRDAPLKLWGWATPGEKISIQFNGKKAAAVTGKDSTWLATLPAMKAGGPFTLNIEGRNKVTIREVLIGDVWFCSGQSNMVLNMERVKEKYPADIAAANYPQIRNFFIPTLADATRLHDDLPPGKWIAASPAGVLGFGAASYFFARQLYEKYHVPVGIINSSVGGTPIEAWMSEDAIKPFPQYASVLNKIKDTGSVNRTNQSRAAATGAVQPPPEPDQGTSGPKPWYDTGYVPQGWHPFWLPGYWADQGVKGLNGTVWFRKEIEVPASMAGQPARLFMGRIVDADWVYVNGVLAGSTSYQYPPRRYVVPAGVLKAGKNIIVVKVVNTAGKGGFVPDKPYYLTAGSQQIDLRGDWQYKVGQVLAPPRFAGGGAISMQNTPTGLYNTMVAPARNYAVKGFLWYQGETNTGKPDEYQYLLPALIRDWRHQWKQEGLPFLFVQLPNFMEVQYSPSESQWAQLREGQRKSLSVPRTAMAVAIDLGEWNDIHPLGKKGVGERLALAAEHLAYGDQQVVYSGPLYKSAVSEGNKVVLRFDHTGSGLMAKEGGDLSQFAIAGADKKWVWAKAVIQGDQVVVWSDAVAHPAWVRYAWADNPDAANLYNREGLPASPFETAVP